MHLYGYEDLELLMLRLTVPLIRVLLCIELSYSSRYMLFINKYFLEPSAADSFSRTFFCHWIMYFILPHISAEVSLNMEKGVMLHIGVQGFLLPWFSKLEFLFGFFFWVRGKSLASLIFICLCSHLVAVFDIQYRGW